MKDFDQKKNWKEPKFLIGVGGSILAILVVVFFSDFSTKNTFLADVSATLGQTFNDVFGFKEENLLYEVELGEVGASESLLLTGKSSSFVSAEPKAAESGKKNASMVEERLVVTRNSAPIQSSVPKVVERKIQDCSFSSIGLPNQKVFLNEIAWMGGGVSANDEWIELKNHSGAVINLDGWQIKNQAEKIKIVFQASDEIFASGFYLLERTDDDSVLNIVADKIYVGALANGGDWLKLFDDDCNLVDEVNASGGWNKFGGDNVAKKTLERNLNDAGWHTSILPAGTPQAENSE